MKPLPTQIKTWLQKTLRNALLQLVALSLLLAAATMSHAQEHRKPKSSPPPEYPELARKMHLQGVARVEVTVLPDGSVGKVKELGGNPVLLDALVRAVRKWRYESADRESVVEVQYEFKSS
jgi:TonB family protein